MPNRILVTGATGYIGGRLVPHLLNDQNEVVCLVRERSTLDRPFADQVQIARGSADDSEAVAAAAKDCDIAYYLIHSLDGDEFEEKDRQMARAFRRGCERAGVRRIVYLGGLGDESEELSPHLRSRQETGRELAAGSTPVTELRAAIIIGSGSASFEMLRTLTEALPVMITPSWVHKTRCQPTAIDDVLKALNQAQHRSESGHDVLELGGPDVVTYAEMMQTYAEVADLPKRRILGLPVLTPNLSSHWVSFVTPLPGTLAKQLVGSLANDVIVTGKSAVEAFGLRPLSFETSVRNAVAMVDDLVIPTSWSGNAREDLDATPDADDPSWAGGRVFEDRRVVTSGLATPRDVFGVVSSLGGDKGWMWGNALWQIRGTMDQIIGGSGLRRGRRHPTDLAIGDALDFWRVVRLEMDSHLRLRAEMKLPGYAWLEWSIQETKDPSGRPLTEMIQRARYVPRGLAGRAYWYVLVPFHQIIFPRMASRIMAEAERAHDEKNPD